MLKQCVFCYEELDGVKVLRAWPLRLYEDCTKILSQFTLPTAYCAVAHELWAERLYPPKERTLPGKLIGRGLVKQLSRDQLVRSLRLIPCLAPIDFLLFAPRRKLVPSEYSGIEKAVEFSKTEIPAKLKRYGGMCMYVHDEDNTTVMTRSDQILLGFYASCVRLMENAIENRFVRQAWLWLCKNQGQAQVVCGYQRTLFFRQAPATVLSYNELGAVLHWDVSSGEVQRAGKFVPGFMR